MTRLDRYLIAVVFAHLVAVLVHTVSHLVRQILPSTPDTWFILGVILIGPVASLPLLRFSRAFAGGLLAVLMVSAFGYGFQSHFLAPGPDHVSNVGSEPWSTVFIGSAAAIGVLELAAVVVGIAVFLSAIRIPSGSVAPRP